MILKHVPEHAHRPIRIGLIALVGYLFGLGIAVAQTTDLPPWLSGSDRDNPFDPWPSAPEAPGEVLGGLEPLPPVPLFNMGPTVADRFQAILDGGRMQGVMTLANETRALVLLNGQILQVQTGDTVRVDELTLTVLEVAPEAVVFSAEDGTLVGMLPRDPDTGLQVDRSGQTLVIRSLEKAAE